MSRASETPLILLLAWGALAFGGVYPWGYWSITLGAGAWGLVAVARTRAWRDAETRTAAYGLGVVAVAMGLQAMPLPRSLFLFANPAADRVLAESDVQYVLQPPTWHALSILPENTLIVGAVFLGLAVLFLGLTHALARSRMDRLVMGIISLGVVLAVFAVIQRAANVRSADGWQLVYGFWKPRQAGDVFGPFINRNHFAGWMVMALPLAIGYSCAVVEASGLSARDDWRRWLRWTMRPEASRFMALAVAVLAMGAALTISGSRSGVVSFAVAVAVMGHFSGKRIGRRRLRVLAASYLVLLVSGAILWAGLGATARRFSTASADAGSRMSAWRDTLHIIRDFPIFGTGVGSYARAMLVYQTSNRDLVFAQAHNDYLQVAAEGGVLVGVPVTMCLIGLVGGIRRRAAGGDDGPVSYWVRAGAIAGLSGIAAQSCVDFSLQLAGNTVLFVVIAAIALHRPPVSPHHARRV